MYLQTIQYFAKNKKITKLSLGKGKGLAHMLINMYTSKESVSFSITGYWLWL